jgi:tetratricopeptide (TPR) repeat protein
MNSDEAILQELRKLSAYADMQRKITKWSFIFIGIFISALIIFGIVMESRLNKSEEDIAPSQKKESSTWTDVDWRIRRGEPAEAIRIGEALIQDAPLYPDGHRLLASAYLAAGKVEQAREHYTQAFQLFPSDENGKLLAAITRRIETDPKPGGLANRSQPIRSETNSTSATAGSAR